MSFEAILNSSQTMELHFDVTHGSSRRKYTGINDRGRFKAGEVVQRTTGLNPGQQPASTATASGAYLTSTCQCLAVVIGVDPLGWAECFRVRRAVRGVLAGARTCDKPASNRSRMACSERYRLQREYDASLRHWAYLQSYCVTIEAERQALAEFNSAKTSLTMHQRNCNDCRSPKLKPLA
jgi:hypothetical protein